MQGDIKTAIRTALMCISGDLSERAAELENVANFEEYDQTRKALQIVSSAINYYCRAVL